MIVVKAGDIQMDAELFGALEIRPELSGNFYAVVIDRRDVDYYAPASFGDLTLFGRRYSVVAAAAEPRGLVGWLAAWEEFENDGYFHVAFVRRTWMEEYPIVSLMDADVFEEEVGRCDGMKSVVWSSGIWQEIWSVGDLPEWEAE